MAHVDHVRQQHFLCSFHTATEANAERFFTSRADSADNHWKIWSAFCANVALDPLLLSHKDLILILASFAAEYCQGDISTSGKNSSSRMVEDSVRFIGQAISAMGAKYSRLNSERLMYICLKFQYRA